MKFIETLKSNFLFKNVAILASASGLSQVVAFIASIFIAYIYSPAAIGEYALYYSIVAILSTCITLGFDTTIYLSASDMLSNNAMVLNMLIAVFFSFFFYLIISFLPMSVFRFLGLEAVEKYKHLLAFSLISSIVCTLMTMRVNRAGKFRSIASIKIVTAITGALTQIGLGLMMLGSLGLIVSNIITYLIADVALFFILTKGDFKLSQIKLKLLAYIFKRNKQLALYMAPASVVSSVSNELPVLLISKLFGETAVGLFSFGQKIIVTPLNFIFSSFQDVFQSEASKDWQAVGNCRKIYRKVFRMLLPVSIVGLLGFVFFAPIITNTISQKNK